MPQLRFINSAMTSLASGAKKLIADDDIAAHIDQLVNVEAPDSGYAQFFSGSNFLPYDDSEKIGTAIYGGTGRKHSPVMQKIVEAGFDAVPALLDHLSDKRRTKLAAIESGGFMWIAFNNEYDFNRATAISEPEGINLNGFVDQEGTGDHEITVGDLCFVALGQIVNRYWLASRYQPTGGRIISSPTYSTELRQVILDEWGGLDRDGHRDRLVEDFRKPDSVDRIIGAYQRLALYYPDEVESLVLELLDRQIPSRRNTIKFVKELVEITDADVRRARLNEILSEHGQHYRDAIQDEIFNEITVADVRERNGIQLNDDELTARRVLRETFGWPTTVRYADWTRKPKLILDDYEMARVIKSLTHDHSLKIGQTVQTMMEADRYRAKEYMVEACLTCLASRDSFADYLASCLRVVDFRGTTQDEYPRSYLKAIARSDSPAIQEQLEKISQVSRDPSLFLIAAKSVARDSDAWEPLVRRAIGILDLLPPGTTDGKQLLGLIIEKSPADAEEIFMNFLKPNTPERCNTVCEVLWHHPLSQIVLLPLLEDTRVIPANKFSVRDRAATAISHSIESIRFESDWSQSRRDDAIKAIKDYCQRQ